MQSFRKQINESFFNPLLHFIPLLLFLFLYDSFGSAVALTAVYVAVVAILVYGFLLYLNIYKYLGVSYLVSTLIIAIIIFFPDRYVAYSLKPVFSEYITMFSFMLIVLLRRRITKFVSEGTPKHIAMTNNLDEHFRIVWQLTVLLFVYTHTYIISALIFKPESSVLTYITQVYWGVLFFVVFYEFIRVTLIRVRLFKEEWWPIVNENGKLIGSIQSQESLLGSEKYIHPIVRGILINDSKVFLQKRSQNNRKDAYLWDVALSNYMRINETVEQCIDRTSYENYGIKDIKPVLLSKYTQQSENSNQYVYLFLLCNLNIVDINPELIDSVKWWTIQQIDDNIQSGIFTENFVKEFDILKRSGLLENGTYKCNCRLKEVVFQGIDKPTSA